MLHIPLERETVIFRRPQRFSLLSAVEVFVVRPVLVAHRGGQEDFPDLRLSAIVAVEYVHNAVQAQMAHRRQLAFKGRPTQLGGVDGEAVAIAHGSRGEERCLEED